MKTCPRWGFCKNLFYETPKNFSWGFYKNLNEVFRKKCPRSWGFYKNLFEVFIKTYFMKQGSAFWHLMLPASRSTKPLACSLWTYLWFVNSLYIRTSEQEENVELLVLFPFASKRKRTAWLNALRVEFLAKILRGLLDVTDVKNWPGPGKLLGLKWTMRGQPHTHCAAI